MNVYRPKFRAYCHRQGAGRAVISRSVGAPRATKFGGFVHENESREIGTRFDSFENYRADRALETHQKSSSRRQKSPSVVPSRRFLKIILSWGVDSALLRATRLRHDKRFEPSFQTNNSGSPRFLNSTETTLCVSSSWSKPTKIPKPA
jgi:hypothetical protein